jgi:hypothetical protein
LYSAKVCYRHHPLFGVEVEVIRYLRQNSAARVVIVRCPGHLQLAVPEWMLNPLVCERLTDEQQPRIAIEALWDLRQLLNEQMTISPTQVSSCAESSTGGKNAQRRLPNTATESSVRKEPSDLDRDSRKRSRTLPKSVHPAVGRGFEKSRVE